MNLRDESGEKKILSDKDIVGLKFFARIWLPAGGNTVYFFIQRYGSLSIKPIFDSIIRKVLEKRKYSMVEGDLKPTTTKKRLDHFTKFSIIKDVITYSAESGHPFRRLPYTFLENYFCVKLKKILLIFKIFSHRFSLQIYPIRTIG